MHDIGGEQLEPPTPFDIGGEHIPGPGEVVVSFDKINELAAEKKAAQAQEPQPPEDKTSEKKAGRGGRPPKADKADKTDKQPKPEKAPKAEKSAKAPKPAKAKQAAGIGGAGVKTTPQKEENPSPEKPPEPREAPRSGGKEAVVYLNLFELSPFKDHPFEVKNDDEMRAMVESVKDKGVTQAAIVRPREDGGYEIV